MIGTTLSPPPTSFPAGRDDRQDTVTILCEGARCNLGRSAEDRERAIRRGRMLDANDVMSISSSVSAELVYRPHVWVGGRYYRCLSCSTVRIYG